MSTVQQSVIDWYQEHGRALPWRDPGCGPWGVLVSEVMLQQTPVARVLPCWREWLRRWPRPSDLAAASAADVLRAWGRLGYPRRALRLRECAAAIVDRHGCAVPRDDAALRALPGVGDYTAAAVRAFAFGERTTVLDTNVRRVLARVWGGEALPAPHLHVAERAAAAARVPEDRVQATRWAVASMELGALVCTARSPRCEICPISEHCVWNNTGRPADPHADRRRRQDWNGSDRQVRGTIMALLRETERLSHDELAVAVRGRVTGQPGPGPSVEVGDAQLRRCLAGLVADGLARNVNDHYQLP